MAYQTGASSSPGDLIASLIAFAVTQGFTDRGNWSAGGFSVASCSKGSTYFNFQWNSTSLDLNTSTALNGNVITSQPDCAPVSSGVHPIAGPHIGYHFFSDGERIHAVVEVVTDVFVHLSFGHIDKSSAWDGTGGYVSSTRWNNNPLISTTSPVNDRWYDGYHSRIFDGVGNSSLNPRRVGHVRVDWIGTKMGCMTAPNRSSEIGGMSIIECSAWGFGSEIMRDSPNSFNTRSVIMPIIVTLGVTQTNVNTMMEIGTIPNAGAVRLDNLNPKEVVNTDWMVFPLCQTNGPGTSYISSGTFGVAYRK